MSGYEYLLSNMSVKLMLCHMN